MEKWPIVQILRDADIGVLTYSPLAFPWNVAVTYMELILTKEYYQQGCIITQNKEEVLDILAVSTEDYSEKISVFDYADEIEDCTALNNGVAIFDSLNMISLDGERFVDIVRLLKKKYNMVLILTDFDTDNKSIAEMLSNFSPEKIVYLSDHSFTQVDNNNTLDRFKVVRYDTKLTDVQKLKIKEIFDTDSNVNAILTVNNPLEKDEYIDIVRRYFNVVYPFEIEKLINSGDEEISGDLIIKIFGYQKVLQYAPKIAKLIDIVNLNCAEFKKHVIFSAFDDFSGTKLIKILLENLDAEQEKYQIVTIDKDMTDDEKTEAIDFYNSIDTGILITSEAFTEYPKFVNYFHIMDGFLLDSVDMINKIYKDQNYKATIHFDYPTVQPLTVNIYSASSEGDVKYTIDKYYMDSLQNKLELICQDQQERYDIGYKVKDSTVYPPYKN